MSSGLVLEDHKHREPCKIKAEVREALMWAEAGLSDVPARGACVHVSGSA